MEEMVFEFFKQYGWQLTLIACSGILVLGILKFFNVFKKIDESKQKYVYAGISSGFSIAAAAIYLVATHAFTWAGFGVAAIAVYTLNQTLYSMYENYGLRNLLQKLGNFFISLVAKKRVANAEEKYLLTIGNDIEPETSTETEAATNDNNGTADVSATELEHTN